MQELTVCYEIVKRYKVGIMKVKKVKKIELGILVYLCQAISLIIAFTINNYTL